MSDPDAIVIGAGPNGLAAAITLARAGRRVTVYEARDTVGGGVSSAELTLPGFVHDVCSAVYPVAAASPVFRTLPLKDFGLEWIEPPVQLAHPLDTGAAIAWRSLERTAAALGEDASAYRRLVGWMARSWPKLEDGVLGPIGLPRHPFAMASFGIASLTSAGARARRAFRNEEARAMFAGMAAHAILPLDRFPTGAVGLMFSALVHAVGWPFPKGGSQRLADAMAALLRSLGGEIVTGARVKNVDDLPPARAILIDLAPRPLLAIAGHRFPAAFRAQLERYRYGMGVFKIDWALDAPIPWRDPRVAGAGTVHVGGTLDEVSASELAVWNGRTSDRPFVLLAQPTLFDPSRAPAGKHVAWGYCHVPNGSTTDMSGRIEAQIERFAPGFGERVLARHVMTTADFERRNPNIVGGDIGMGAMSGTQLFFRPTWRQYRTPAKGIYICSAATPPGGGVHGMCGYFAARAALRDVLA